MREITETVLEDYPLQNITKIILNKSLESETIVEGFIIDTSKANVILKGIEDSSKGKELKESKYIKGVITLSLDKTNYDTLVQANYEFVQGFKIQGLDIEDLYKFVANENGRYIVEI